MKAFLKTALILSMVLLLLVGCSSAPASSLPASNSESADASAPAETSEGKKFNIVFTTSTGAAETHAKVLTEVVAPELERLSG